MKKKFSVIAVLFLIMCLSICFFACDETGNKNPTDNGEKNEQETPKEEKKFYPVVVYNGRETIENTYEEGTNLTVKAKDEDGKVFVCWLMENEEYTDLEEFTFTVEQPTILKAVYASAGKVLFDLNGGEKNEEEKTKVLAYKELPIETNDSLYIGYKFVLPVPRKTHYTFIGWYSGEEKITDENGESLNYYDGKTRFTAIYEENPYVEIELKGGNEQIETRSIKHYLEDGNLEITSVPIFYKKVTGWKIDTWASKKHNDDKNFAHSDENKDGKCDICGKTESEIFDIESNGDFVLNVDNLENKKKYVFRAFYKEVYKIVVRKGSGTGAYAREDTLNISAIKNPGLNFTYWEIAGGKLGFYEKNLCILKEDEDSFDFYICSDEEQSGIKHISVPSEEYEDNGKFVCAGNSEIKIPLSKLEKLITKITGEGFEGTGNVEKETIISANFNPNEYTVVYELNCWVNGKICVSTEEINALINAGFKEKEEGIYVKEIKAEYNSKLILEIIPEIENYTFGNWQRKGGGNIPSVMPAEEGLTFSGTFIPDKHFVTVQIRDSEKAKGSVYMEGNVTSAYYPFGKEIGFTVVANRGYEAWKWLDISSEPVWEKESATEESKIKLVGTEEDGDKIRYGFKYTVTGRETFTLTFDEREYNIIYKISVQYTQKGNVTEDEEYFENGQEGMNKFSQIKEMVESVKYNTQNCNFMEMNFEDEFAERYIETGLKWGNSHWEFSGWSADNQGLSTLKDFTMPAKDIIANATFTIKRHRVNFSGTAGVITDAYLINDIEANKYRIEDSESIEYRIPYGADIKIKVKYPTGYSYGSVKINGETIFDLNEGGIKEAKFENIDGGTKYDYLVNFKFEKVNSGMAPVYFEANQNKYTLKYYVGYDFENKDEEKNIDEYLELDKEQEIVVNGDKYYYLKKIKEIGGDVTAEQEYVYNNDIKLHSISTNVIPYEYVFSNWKKYVNASTDGGTVQGSDVGTKMPDENCFACGKLVLNTYAFSIGKRTFDFEENPNEEKNTVVVSEEYSAGNQDDADSSLRYFSEKKLIAYEATGYEFKKWKLETTYDGVVNTVLDIDEREKEKDVIIEETVSDYVFKYRINSEDKSISVFMTESLRVSAEFEKIKYKVKVKDKYISILSDNIIEQSGESYIEYGENLRFTYATNSVAAGKRVSLIKITDMNKTESDEGYLVENVNVPFDEDIINYTSNVYYTSLEKGVQSDINIDSVIENIRYKMTYVVYGPQDNIADLDTTEEYVITADFEGNPYYATYSEDYKLMSESLLKQHLAEMNTGINLSAVMYSGWQRGNISRTDTEGKGFLNDSGVYEGERIHHQRYYGIRGESARSVYYCYLVNIYSYTDVSGGVLANINGTILSTNNYNKYFGSINNEIIIPSTNGDYNVIGIGEGGFIGCSGLKTVVLSDTIETIAQNAFSGCKALKNVIFGKDSKLKTIADNAFSGCYVLQTMNTEADSQIVTFPKTTASVGKEAFKGCSSVREIVITENLVNIGLRAFANCSMLSKIVYNSNFSESIGKMNSGIFYESGKDGNLSTGVDVIIGIKARTIPVGLFSCMGEVDEEKGGKYLRNVTFEEGENASKVSIPGGAFYGSGIVEFNGSKRITAIGTRAFYECRNLLKADLSATLATSISEDCFRKCERLTEVILPSTLETIGRAAFCEDNNLVSIYYAGDGIKTISDFAFAKGETQMSMERFVPYSLYEEVQNDPDAHKSIILKNIESIGKNAFLGFEKATLLVIEGENTEFGESSFYGTRGLKKIIYDVTESTCGGKDYPAFKEAGSLSGVVLEIGERVRTIPAYMFCDLEPVMEITIPSNLESVGNSAFLNVTKLRKIYYNVTAMPTTYTRSPFWGSGTGIETIGIEVVIGENVTLVPEGMFKELGLLKKVDFGALGSESNLIIGASAFESSGITSIEIPAINKLTVKENVFKNTNLVSFEANSQINTVEIYKNAISGVNNVNKLNAEIFGKTISSAGNGIWGSVTEGYISVSRNGLSGYDGTVYGNVTVLGNAEIGINDKLTFNGDSSLIFTTNKSIIVKGDVEINEMRITKASGYRLIGASYTVADFKVKNDKPIYNELLICDNLTFAENVNVSNRNKFEIMNDKKVSFEGGLSIDGSVSNYIGNAEVKGGSLTLNCNNILSGRVDVYSGVEAIVNNIKTIGDGLNVISGFIRIENSTNRDIRYIIPSDSVAQIQEEVNYFDNNDEYVVEGSLTVSKEARLPYLINKGMITISDDVNNGASLTVIYDETNGYPENGGSILSDVYKYNTDNNKNGLTYIGSINKAFNENEETRYYMMRNIEKNSVVGINYAIELDFNGFELTAGSGININNGASVKLIKTKLKGYINIGEYSTLTAEGDGTQKGSIVSEVNDNAIVNDGIVVLNNVDVTGINTVLAKERSQTTINGGSIVASNDAGSAITTISDVTVKNALITGSVGIKINDPSIVDELIYGYSVTLEGVTLTAENIGVNGMLAQNAISLTIKGGKITGKTNAIKAYGGYTIGLRNGTAIESQDGSSFEKATIAIMDTDNKRVLLETEENVEINNKAELVGKTSVYYDGTEIDKSRINSYTSDTYDSETDNGINLQNAVTDGKIILRTVFYEQSSLSENNAFVYTENGMLNKMNPTEEEKFVYRNGTGTYGRFKIFENSASDVLFTEEQTGYDLIEINGTKYYSVYLEKHKDANEVLTNAETKNIWITSDYILNGLESNKTVFHIGGALSLGGEIAGTLKTLDYGESCSLNINENTTVSGEYLFFKNNSPKNDDFVVGAMLEVSGKVEVYTNYGRNGIEETWDSQNKPIYNETGYYDVLITENGSLKAINSGVVTLKTGALLNNGEIDNVSINVSSFIGKGEGNSATNVSIPGASYVKFDGSAFTGNFVTQKLLVYNTTLTLNDVAIGLSGMVSKSTVVVENMQLEETGVNLSLEKNAVFTLNGYNDKMINFEQSEGTTATFNCDVKIKVVGSLYKATFNENLYAENMKVGDEYGTEAKVKVMKSIEANAIDVQKRAKLIIAKFDGATYTSNYIDLGEEAYVEYLGSETIASTGIRIGIKAILVLGTDNATAVGYSEENSGNLESVEGDVMNGTEIVGKLYSLHWHDHRTVSPTCIKKGYDHCISAVDISGVITEDGYTVNYSEERFNFVDATGHGNSGYTAINGTTKHKCNDCEYEENHDKTKVRKRMLPDVYMNVIATSCGACGHITSIKVIDGTRTIANVKTEIEAYVSADTLPEGGILSVNPSDDETALISDCVKQVDGEKRIITVANESFYYYEVYLIVNGDTTNATVYASILVSIPEAVTP